MTINELAEVACDAYHAHPSIGIEAWEAVVTAVVKALTEYVPRCADTLDIDPPMRCEQAVGHDGPHRVEQADPQRTTWEAI